jgi:pSer/pThr/pTyr-binding forkhead associated (FHA) protein
MDINLVLFRKGGEPKPFLLPSRRVLIGRAKECDFWIPLLSVSRRHCEITVDEVDIHIHDLNSHNGTFVNGMRVENATLHPGDFIRVGPILFGVQIGGVPKELVPPDFVMLDENDGQEHPSEGSTITHAHTEKGHSDEGRDVADDILSWLNDKEKRNGQGNPA